MADSTPFEGPEKLLEIWFTPSPRDLVSDQASATTEEINRCGLRSIPVKYWEEMLDIVRCKILSSIHGAEIDAYLLSESSFFVWPHKLILKTCGRTLNLLGVPRILAIAAEHAGLKNVYQLFYSRKSFMFPEHQLAPHRDWTAEVQFLDNIFEGAGGGNAYTIGKVNGDHWLLYITGPGASDRDEVVSTLPALDYTVEIMMSDLAQPARAPFFCSGDGGGVPPLTDAERGMKMSEATRITTLFPTHLTTLDAYAFTPCGYSSNALIKWGMDSDSKPAKHPPGGHIPSEHGEHEVGSEGEGYYTIHVTPEEGYSYASFECNIALPADTPHSVNPAGEFTRIPDLRTLVRRVAAIFQPGRLTLSIFMSTSNYQDSRGDTEIEAAQKAFRAALQGIEKPDAPGESVRYRRTDKINYEFGSYDLAFATFERRNAER